MSWLPKPVRRVRSPAARSSLRSWMQAKAAHRSPGEDGPLGLQKSYGWQSQSRSSVRSSLADLSTSVPTRRTRVQDVSKACPRGLRRRDAPVQSTADRVSNRAAETQVHVALRRRQVRMAGQFLDGPCRRALDRPMRTERVPQDVHRPARCLRRAERRAPALMTRSRVIAEPSTRHSTRSDRRCRAPLRAAASSRSY